MIRALASVLSRWSTRWVPDPFVIAILLTLLTVALVWAVTGVDPLGAIGNWGGRIKGDALLPKERGLWKLLTFGMQVCLTLVTGHALASAPAVRRGIRAVVDRIGTPTGAIAFTALAAMLAGFVNWALGLIVGALFARDMGRSAARRGVRVHYPLLGAAGYTGLLVWHGGLSGSAPLKVTLQKEIQDIMPGVDLAPIALTETLLSPLNLVVGATMLAAVPLILILMRPRDADVRTIEAFLPVVDEDVPARAPPTTPAEHLEQSRPLALALAAMALIYLVMYLGRVGVDRLDLNSVNLIFLTIGLLLHGRPKPYVNAVSDGAGSCAGIILQFPFYAGIMGLMALSGLLSMLAAGIASVADGTTFSAMTFLSAGVVNLLVPSGGGQWAIQGPIVVQAAHALGVPMGKAVMAFCYGDQWTNMLQPFWALPLLGITGLRAGDLIGYTASLMVVVAPLFVAALLLF